MNKSTIHGISLIIMGISLLVTIWEFMPIAIPYQMISLGIVLLSYIIASGTFKYDTNEVDDE